MSVSSRSLMNGDFARFTSFFALFERERDLELLLLFDSDEGGGSSSIREVDEVVVELREKRVELLPAVLAVPVSVELRLSAVRERRWLPTEPPKKSVTLAAAEREPKRLRDITSRPKMATREREAVGVVGRLDVAFVLNLNKPY